MFEIKHIHSNGQTTTMSSAVENTHDGVHVYEYTATTFGGDVRTTNPVRVPDPLAVAARNHGFIVHTTTEYKAEKDSLREAMLTEIRDGIIRFHKTNTYHLDKSTLNELLEELGMPLYSGKWKVVIFIDGYDVAECVVEADTALRAEEIATEALAPKESHVNLRFLIDQHSQITNQRSGAYELDVDNWLEHVEITCEVEEYLG